MLLDNLDAIRVELERGLVVVFDDARVRHLPMLSPGRAVVNVPLRAFVTRSDPQSVTRRLSTTCPRIVHERTSIGRDRTTLAERLDRVFPAQVARRNMRRHRPDGLGQPGGSRGREFESPQPDHKSPARTG